MADDEERRLDIPDVRKLLKGKVASPSKLSQTEVLLKASAYRLIDRNTFDEIRNRHLEGRAHKKTKDAFAALAWPETSEPVPEAPKRKRPDKAARMADAKTKKFDTVTCSWRKVCKDNTRKVLRLSLQAVMDRLNQVTIEAYELANFHVIRCLTENGGVSSVLDNTFFYRCCNAVCVNESGNRVTVDDASLDESAKRFHGWRGQTQRPAICNRGLSRPFQVLSGDMETASDNMFNALFFRRLRAWVRKTLDCSARQVRKVVALTVGDRKDEDTQDAFVLRLRGRLPPATKLSASNKHLFMPMLRMFQRHVAGNRHSLLPHKKGFKPHMLTINASTLRVLLIEAGVHGIPDEPSFLANKDKWWRRLFNIRRHETSRRFFGSEIVTDGKSARILMYRRLDVPAPSKKEAAAQAAAHPVPTVDWSKVVDVRSNDPGKRCVASSAGVRYQRDEEGNVTTTPTPLPILQFSGPGFYHDAKYNLTAAKERAWKEARPDVVAAEKDLTETVKNYDNIRDAEERMVGMWDAMDVLIPFYSDNRFKNTRLTRFVGARKALSAIALKMTDGRTDPATTVVAVGDWGGSASGIKGTPCGPHRRLVRELGKVATVFEVDEDYTSKTCWCCHLQQLKNMVAKNGKGRLVKIHGVLHCTSSECKGKTWDRDHNGALNILEIAMCLLRGWERPTSYRDQTEPAEEAESTRRRRRNVAR